MSRRSPNEDTPPAFSLPMGDDDFEREELSRRQVEGMAANFNVHGPPSTGNTPKDPNMDPYSPPAASTRAASNENEERSPAAGPSTSTSGPIVARLGNTCASCNEAGAICRGISRSGPDSDNPGCKFNDALAFSIPEDDGDDKPQGQGRRSLRLSLRSMLEKEDETPTLRQKEAVLQQLPEKGRGGVHVNTWKPWVGRRK